MKPITLRARLVSAFAIIIGIAALVGWFALNRLATLNGTMRDVVNHRRVMADLTNRTLELSIENSRLTLQMMLSIDPRTVSDLRKEIPRNSASIKSLIQEIKKGARLPEEKALLVPIESRRELYLSSRRAAEKLLVEGHRDEAITIAFNEMLPNLKVYRRAWNDFATYQRKSSEVAVQQSLEEFQTARTVILISILLAVVAGAALSWRVTRAISRPIVDLARVAKIVSANRDYRLRASPRTPIGTDDIDVLVSCFNDMLTEIERRDAALQQHRMDLEEQVKRRTHELSTILDSAGEGIIGLDERGVAAFVNPSAARILGWKAEELVGRSLHEVICCDPEAQVNPNACVRCGDSIAVRAARTANFRTRNGAIIPVECTAGSIVGENGVSRGVVVTFRDVTERQAIERLKDEFVSTVSHELRTPLTSIRGALGLLSSGMIGDVGEKGQRMLDIAVVNTDRLVRLINDILDVERIDAGKIELQYGEVDAHAIMSQTAEGLQAIAEESGIEIVVRPVGATLWIDSDRIVQTLTNLVSNAVKFSPSGSIVTLGGDLSPDGVFTFRVGDQGRGIPVDKLETVFERFKQVNASDSRDKGGTGLGLAICRSIVNAHGGRIWAEQNGEKGTLVQFVIPGKQHETGVLPIPSVAVQLLG